VSGAPVRPRVVNLADAHSKFDEPWSPKRIARVDGYEVKLAKGEGGFAWHAHVDEDELFYVTKGVLRIEIENGEPLVLHPGDLTVVPKGLRHRPVVQQGPVEILLFERAGVVNTGDAGAGDLTQTVEDL
jgi:mannose-6-phosphate isomerase-like protein (cupin superfamily)